MLSNMRYLSAEEILVLHSLVIEQYGGSHGVREIELLKSVAHKPQSTFGGSDLYPALWDKAATLCEALVNYHVFVDGNKRTALIAAARFLAINGHEFTATNSQAEKVIYDVAEKKIDSTKLAVWLKKHSRKLK